MAHLDVVPVEAENWTHPPFAAEIAEGYVYGRGALDAHVQQLPYGFGMAL